MPPNPVLSPAPRGVPTTAFPSGGTLFPPDRGRRGPRRCGSPRDGLCLRVAPLHRSGAGCHPHHRRHDPDRLEGRIPPLHVFAGHGHPLPAPGARLRTGGPYLGNIAPPRAGGVLLAGIGGLLATRARPRLFTPPARLFVREPWAASAG